MIRRLMGFGVAALCIFTAGCADHAKVHFEEAPAGHVALPGEAVDPSAAYVAIVPHLVNRTGRQGTISHAAHVSTRPEARFLAWLTTVPAFGGKPVSVGVALPVDRPSVVRLPPGRYFVSRVFVESDVVYYDIDESYSVFDARPGQLNYPGDWTIETGYHEITQGARHMGYYFNATLAESGSSDLVTLVADAGASVAKLPRAYTRQVPSPSAMGER